MGLNSSGGQIVRKIGGSRYFGWFVGGVPETRHTLWRIGKPWKTKKNQEKSQNTRNTTIDQGRSRVFYTNKKVKPLKTKKTKKTTINIRKPPSENHVFFTHKKTMKTIENH